MLDIDALPEENAKKPILKCTCSEYWNGDLLVNVNCPVHVEHVHKGTVAELQYQVKEMRGFMDRLISKDFESLDHASECAYRMFMGEGKDDN